MKVDLWAVLGSATTLVLLPLIRRLIDYLLPRGRHFRFVERYSVREETGKNTEEEEQ